MVSEYIILIRQLDSPGLIMSYNMKLDLRKEGLGST